jgi:hypothetical protein
VFLGSWEKILAQNWHLSAIFFYLVVNFGGRTDLVVCLEDLFLCHSSGFTGPTVYRADSNQA